MLPHNVTPWSSVELLRLECQWKSSSSMARRFKSVSERLIVLDLTFIPSCIRSYEQVDSKYLSKLIPVSKKTKEIVSGR